MIKIYDPIEILLFEFGKESCPCVLRQWVFPEDISCCIFTNYFQQVCHKRLKSQL